MGFALKSTSGGTHSESRIYTQVLYLGAIQGNTSRVGSGGREGKGRQTVEFLKTQLSSLVPRGTLGACVTAPRGKGAGGFL